MFVFKICILLLLSSQSLAFSFSSPPGKTDCYFADPLEPVPSAGKHSRHQLTQCYPSRVEVHCLGDTLFPGCLLQESLNLRVPSTLKFGSVDAWNDTELFTIGLGSKVAVMPSGIFERFQSLRIIELWIGLESIKKDDFINSNNLLELNLRSNALEILASDVFVFMRTLKVIDLSRNKLQTIEDSTFNGMSNLETLRINENALTMLKKNTFIGAVNLTNLELSSNRIESIEVGALDLPKLEQIDLTANRLRSLSDNVFTGAPLLRTISVAFNNLTHIGRTFYDLINIRKISLNNNMVADLDLIAFAKIAALKELSLGASGFRLSNLGRWPAIDSSITHLDLSANKLRESDVISRLQPLDNLVELDLDENEFETISGIDEIKQKFKNLKVIRLSKGRLSCANYVAVVKKLRDQNVTVPLGADTECSLSHE